MVLFICSSAHWDAAFSFFVSANFLGLSLVHFLSVKHLNIILSLLKSVTIQEHSNRTQKLVESEESNTALSRHELKIFSFVYQYFLRDFSSEHTLESLKYLIVGVLQQ